MGFRWSLAVALVVTVAVARRDTSAQVPVRADTTAARRDSLARDSVARDSLAKAEAARQARLRALAADTIKAPIARAEVPPLLTIGEPYAWTRSQYIASSALTLGELVDRVPGVTTYKSGWISAPEMAALYGRFGRVRIFLDGIEMDPLNSRLRGQHDLSLVDLWHLDDITIEPAADEVRVYLRSWRVDNTTPVTRIEVNTGDIQTNKYQGFFGRRFQGGQVVQAGGSHYATTDRRTAEAGDQTSLWARLGVARNNWSADASFLRSGRKFTERILGDEPATSDTLPTMDGTWTIAIARAAWGDPMKNGPWIQGIASAQSYAITNPPLTVIDSVEGPGGGGPGGSQADPDTLQVDNDTTQSRPQFVLTGGLTRGPLRLSALGRVRRWHGATSLSPAVRVGYQAGGLTLSFLGERSPLDSVQRLEGGANFVFGGRWALNALVSQFSPIENADAPTSMSIRAEVGMRAGRMWLTAGALRRDTTFLPAAIAFDTLFGSGAQGSTNGLFATVRGKFYRDVGVDISAVKYDAAGIYRPQWETRSRLYVDSDMRTKFPSGNLNIMLAVVHDYRTEALFPVAGGFLESSQFRSWGAEVVVRLLTATITFQFRNFLGAEYQQVPGFRMPGPTSIYGVSWTFVN